ncbi:N-acetyltransferase Eis [Streptomyces sp. RB5]|uniref:N-acetyltransferase Eis n=1 Tax=Streptomyces smaragdinus TaxID=2585196 RepID=A0A7K0CS91_9ACTN|nr:GNAT family N-acetyltransferase [Streptomyces smaragdinus]MQY16321.1 N-acetyltransferase Eis [Streptomyces smaragdinus]
MSDLDVRTITEDEAAEWYRAVHTGFLNEPVADPEDVAKHLPAIDLSRTQGAWDGKRCVGTFRSFAQQLTVPGGAAVPATAVSNVTVTSTHRRRGLLTRMMANDLRAAKDRGDAAATLIAAEYPIYGHHGFGPATWVTAWDIDIPRTGLDRRYRGPDDGGTVELITADEVRTLGPALHDRFRPLTPGAVDRDAQWWRESTGEVRFTHRGPWKEPHYALYRAASGEPQGLASYHTDSSDWRSKLPHCKAEVLKLIATTPSAERALWHYLCSIDWVTTLSTGFRAPDDLLPLLLPDPRAARINAHADFLWLRPLDTPRLLTSRTYATAGTLTLELVDPHELAGGRFTLETDGTQSTCTPTTHSPDLTLPVSSLAPLYLGDESPTRLAALNRLTEHRPGAVTTAETLFHTPRRPWCPDVF